MVLRFFVIPKKDRGIFFKIYNHIITAFSPSNWINLFSDII